MMTTKVASESACSPSLLRLPSFACNCTQKANFYTYNMTVSSIPSSVAPSDGYNLLEPIIGTKCSDILYNVWKNCKHYYFPVILASPKS